jgi:hypothetical protein
MTPEEAFHHIEENEKRLSSYATEPARVIDLIQNIKMACNIYLETPPPGELQREINALINAVKKRPMDVPRILEEGLSPNTAEFISEKGSIPNPDEFREPSTQNDALRHLKSMLSTGGHWEQGPDQRRWRPRSIVQPVPRGRPGTNREEVLVSLLAAAFVSATDIVPIRNWSNEQESPFVKLVDDVLGILEIENDYSAENLVRRHIKAMSDIKLTRMPDTEG